MIDDIVCLAKYLGHKSKGGPRQGDCRLCPGIDPDKRINCKGYMPVTLSLFEGSHIVNPVDINELRYKLEEREYP